MALNPVRLKDDLAVLFSFPGPTTAANGAQWAACMQSYATAIVPPSLSVAAAATTLAGALTAAFASGPATVANVEVAFAAFAATVGVGMAPTFVGVPPVVPVGFAAEMAKPPEQWAQTQADAALLWSNKIHAWMSTGAATLAVPPNTVTPWT